MAVIQCDFYSEALEMSTSIIAVLPQETPTIGVTAAAPADYPTLYLLHGLSDDHTMWLRRTSVERYVAPLGLAVILPQVHRSYYTDEARGNRYWTFLSDELPVVAGRLFHLSSRREDTFVAGLSMGGYGALKWALRQPDRFAAAASLSGALGLAQRLEQSETVGFDRRLWDRIFDSQPIAGTPDDIFWLLDKAPSFPHVPDLYVTCGSDDALYRENLRFEAASRERNIPVTVDFGPGAHTWDYWDAKIQDVLKWLPLRKPSIALTEH
jgi:putative tributyrin esterase